MTAERMSGGWCHNHSCSPVVQLASQHHSIHSLDPLRVQIKNKMNWYIPYSFNVIRKFRLDRDAITLRKCSQCYTPNCNGLVVKISEFWKITSKIFFETYQRLPFVLCLHSTNILLPWFNSSGKVTFLPIDFALRYSLLDWLSLKPDSIGPVVAIYPDSPCQSKFFFASQRLIITCKGYW